ncbi:MAG: hypothetical protein AW07_02182 [Candidatus Accumulibacter sp. SK-11]|nr:MAG: hypothetical protein AW07_02182 [Candidatus Accumulibacter sp. SK-11]
MRLMIACRSGIRNIRGRGFPGCGRGVTVPTSMKPKPSAASASMCSPFLSRPAARPTGLGNSSPMSETGSGGTGLASRQLAPVARNRSTPAMPIPCATSGSSAKKTLRRSG